jgi:flagellar hook assembly protein FlgD
MVLTGGDSTSGVWKATIPAQSPNTEVTYYFRISDIQGACSTDYPSWSYFLGEGNPDHVLLHIGSLIDYGLHDPVRAVRSQVDVWDEKARGAADSTVFEYYTTRAGERGIIWLHWTGARMVEDTAYVRRFLDAGGSLLISSQDLVADFDLWYGPPPYSHWQANPIVSPFCYNYLQLRSGWDDWEAIDTLTSFPAHGVPGDPITGSLPDISVTPASNWTGIFDSVSMGSNEIFHGPRSTIIGFRYEGTHKLIFLYWHFHEIGTGAGKEFEPDTASQNEFMRNALTWLNLTVGVDQTTADIGRSYFLSQNIPNPASEGRTTISYSLPRRERVSLLVYDIAGRRVKKVVDGIKGSGLHQAAWEGGDDLGRQVSQGVYFYRLSAGDFTSTKKMIWLR